MTKYRAAAAILSIFMITSIGAKVSADNVKIAFVDIRRALAETDEGKAALKKLQGLQKKLQKKIAAKEKKIMAMKEELEKQQNILNQEALQKKAQEYYQMVQELQQGYMQHQKELSMKEAKLTQAILVKMEKIIAEIGQSENYTMIYDRSSGAVVWAPAHLDLTDKLIQKYNAKHKPKKK